MPQNSLTPHNIKVCYNLLHHSQPSSCKGDSVNLPSRTVGFTTQGVSEKNGTVAIVPNIYNSRICPDGRKIVVTSGIEIAYNDRQVKKQNLFKLNKLTSLMLPHHRASITHVILTLQQMGF